MRTLVKIDLINENSYSAFREWLKHNNYNPKEPDIKILQQLNNSDNVLKEYINNETGHAWDIIRTIPTLDSERQEAIDSTKYIITFHDESHFQDVFGLVCIDGRAIKVRWRHRISKSLEKATENFVETVWDNVIIRDKELHSSRLFLPFSMKVGQPTVIVVREPNETHNIYTGNILPPGKLLRKQIRKNEKKIEWTIFWVGLLATGIFSIFGIILFISTKPEDSLRWISGFCDRFATTAIVSAFVSYLNYKFYLNELKKRLPIFWK